MYSPSKQKLVKQNRSRGKIVFFLTIVVLLIVVIAGILEKTGVTDFYQKSQSKTPTEVAPQPTINLEHTSHSFNLCTLQELLHQLNIKLKLALEHHTAHIVTGKQIGRAHV